MVYADSRAPERTGLGWPTGVPRETRDALGLGWPVVGDERAEARRG